MTIYERLIKKADKWTKSELHTAFFSLVYNIPHYQLKDWFAETFELEEENEKEE